VRARLEPLPGRRPPPWLARPPFAAISRCFSGLIAAKPRFARPLVVVGMIFLHEMLTRTTCRNDFSPLQFAVLMQVRKKFRIRA